MNWLCAGCGEEADADFLTSCDCPTGVLFQRGNNKQRPKGETCHRHADQPSRINLDGDNLCQQCANQWVLGERDAAIEQSQ